MITGHALPAQRGGMELGPEPGLRSARHTRLSAVGLAPTLSLKPRPSLAGDSGTPSTKAHLETKAHTEVLSQTLAH